MIKPGKFIVVEGLEGAGKTTAMQWLKDYLSEHVPLVVTREPGGTALGEALRKLIKHETAPISGMAELLLMYAARMQHIEEKIKPALAQGKWVLCDRFELSTYAYQGGGRGIPLQDITQLSQLCLKGFTPDLILFLEISPELGLARAAQRGTSDRFEKESLSFFNAIYNAYHAHIKTFKNTQIIDATRSIDQVQAQLLTHMHSFVQAHYE